MVHVHCFSTKAEDNITATKDVCERVSEKLGVQMKAGDGEGEVRVYDVRDVAPKKRMFCASFRLPKEVAFRERVS